MLLRNEGAVIKWLSQYEAIERRQLKEMINKSLNSSDSFVNSMLKQSRIANLEDGYIGLDHLCKPDYKLIKAIWILIEFIKNVEPMAHYPATYPSQLFFLLENKGYEVIVLDEGDEDLLKRVQFNSEVTYIVVLPTMEMRKSLIKINAPCIFATIDYTDAKRPKPSFYMVEKKNKET